MYVRPSTRRNGLAGELLATAEHWGREQGCAHVSLDVHRVNEVAQSLYRRKGYEIRHHEMRKSLE